MEHGKYGAQVSAGLGLEWSMRAAAPWRCAASWPHASAALALPERLLRVQAVRCQTCRPLYPCHTVIITGMFTPGKGVSEISAPRLTDWLCALDCDDGPETLLLAAIIA